jgi:hypothetical protein
LAAFSVEKSFEGLSPGQKIEIAAEPGSEFLGLQNNIKAQVN